MAKTLILVSVTQSQIKSDLGLHYLEVEGDFSWLDGLKMQRLPLPGEMYRRMESLFFDSSNYFLKREMKRVESFPKGVYNQIVHCEVWA